MKNINKPTLGIKYGTKEYANKNGIGLKKVLIEITDDYKVGTFIDEDGKYCVGGNVMAMIGETTEELYLIEKAFHTEKMKGILKATDWGGNKMENWSKVFGTFRKDWYKNFTNTETQEA